MFERFTADARRTVVLAREEAQGLRHPTIGTEHLLLALLDLEGTTSERVLAAHGVSRAGVIEGISRHVGTGRLDAEALATLGIDLDAVRERVEATFGPGALEERGLAAHHRVPFSKRAKKVLELSLRESLAMKQRSITDGHILLGLLREGQGLGVRVLSDRGVDAGAVAREVREALAG
jgi:ATP-dependent Clp protease ATP-binding subunit ClpA